MTNPFQWASFAAPTMTPTAGQAGSFNFYRPANSQLPTGQALGNFLMPQGAATDAATVNNRTVKYDGGLTREALFNSTGFLDGQMKTGFEGINTALNNFGTLGGLGSASGASPVYRPNGGAVGQGATNGQPLPWGVSNPFNQTF